MTNPVRTLSAAAFALGLVLTPWSVRAQTAVSVSAQIGSFHIAVSNYYHVPEREVVVVRDRRIRDDELPVVFFIAQRAHVTSATIVDLRLRGLSWWDISVRFHLGPDVYYVPVKRTPGPPYGRAYGYYKKPRAEWNSIRLSDDDVVNLVELRFLSDYYGVEPDRVIEMRTGKSSFVAVHDAVAAEKGRGNANGRGADPAKNSAGRGRGRGGGGR